MANQISLFTSVKTFLNERVGQQFNTSDLIKHTKGIETVTHWKLGNNNPAYRTRYYLTNLGRLEFVKNVKYGVWEVIKPIPTEFNSTSMNVSLGYIY